MKQILCLDCRLVEVEEWESCCSACQSIRDEQDRLEQDRLSREAWLETFEPREDAEYHFGGPNRG